MLADHHLLFFFGQTLLAFQTLLSTKALLSRCSPQQSHSWSRRGLFRISRSPTRRLIYRIRSLVGYHPKMNLQNAQLFQCCSLGVVFDRFRSFLTKREAHRLNNDEHSAGFLCSDYQQINRTVKRDADQRILSHSKSRMKEEQD